MMKFFGTTVVATISEVQKDKTDHIYFEISWEGNTLYPRECVEKWL